MASVTRIIAPRDQKSRRAAWRSVLDEAIREPDELCRLLDLPPSLADEARAAAADRPLLVARPFISRMRRGDPADPLLLQVLPKAAELDAVPGYTADPLDEAAARRAPDAPRLLQKYRGRLLIVTTAACAVHCRFCFRRHFPLDRVVVGADNTGSGLPTSPRCEPEKRCPGRFEPDADAILETIAADRSIHEVILSGGDPLMLSDRKLGELSQRMAGIAHLRRLRVHTRLPVIVPQRVTDGLLGALRCSRLPTVVVIHVNHPAEIDGAVAQALGRMVDAGIPLLSQSVLLRGVNDRVEVLAELFERLVDLRVMPYYLHQLDRVAGAAHFETPEATGRRLLAELRARLPGYAVPRYVRETPGGTSKETLA